MKFFAILAAAALAFAHASFSGEAVKVGGKYYVEDSEGNLIRIPGDSAAPSPRRRPARSGKYGLPHPSSWHSQPQAGQKAPAPAGADVEGPESPRGEPPSAAEASAEYECSVVEIRGGEEDGSVQVQVFPPGIRRRCRERNRCGGRGNLGGF